MVGNNGINKVDWFGLSDSTGPRELVFDFVTGVGPNSHNFVDGDPWTEKMKEHVVIKEARAVGKSLAKTKCPGNPEAESFRINYNLGNSGELDRYMRMASDGIGFGALGLIGLGTDAWYGVIGSFKGEWILSVDCKKCEVKINYFLYNYMSGRSAMRNPATGYTPGSKQAPSNPLGPTGPLRTISMTWDWEEKFDLKTGDPIK